MNSIETVVYIFKTIRAIAFYSSGNIDSVMFPVNHFTQFEYIKKGVSYGRFMKVEIFG